MSESRKGREVATCQQKLIAPLKSLQGDDDADITWKMITKRYPKAAPLLCEMESVIDRAENLLQQLRSPYTQGLERSSSFQIADLEEHDEYASLRIAKESTELISVVSTQKSSAIYEENDISRRAVGTNVVEVGTSEDCAFDAGVNTDSEFQSPRFLSAESEKEFIIRDEVNSRSPSFSTDERAWSHDEERASISESPRISHTARSRPESSLKALERTSSLEGWAKVVGEDNVHTMYSGRPDAVPINLTKNKISKTPSVKQSLKEDNINDYERKLATLKSGPIQEITKMKLLVQENVAMRFADTISTTTKVVDTMKQIKCEQTIGKVDFSEKEKIDERDKIAKDEVGTNEIVEAIESSKVKASELQDASVTKSEGMKNLWKRVVSRLPNESQEPNDESTLETMVQRSPVDILQEYATTYNFLVDYQCKPKNRSYVIKCSLAGYSVESCGKLKKTVKNEVATKMLRLLAGEQMDGDLKRPPFSTNQMEEIMSLGTASEFDSAVRKLYKLSLEKRTLLPVYSRHQVEAIYGSRYAVKCEALGCVALGYGIRMAIAKDEAAGNLLKMYYKDLQLQAEMN